jgi:protein-histidine pros-kinase
MTMTQGVHTGQTFSPADFTKAVLNILEDSAAERTRLRDAQRAVLNILEDSGTEKLRLEEMQKAVLNILDDLAGEVDERKRFEQTLQEKNVELERASFSKDRFLASMSHELRTPLNAIIGFTGTLIMKLPGPLTPDQDKQLKIVQASARHLLSLINDILDLAKIESGKVEINLEPVSCQEIVDEVARTLRPLAEAKGLEFETRLPEAGITVLTDRRALSQIVINLANNAIKFTDKGKVEIELGQRRENGHTLTEISITDTGVGIRSEDQARLFQAFAQADSSSTKRHEGTGLGLHLSRKLAELLGGRIAVSSEVGRGSTFSVVLTET